ncbi:hypothetical protein C0993_001668 [Termitomyces sp. T159_Od127]|nr:hypothetical protein C0993_001668 [Termitomyces sp. T159_Od127]
MLASTTAGSIPNSNEGLTPLSISRTPGSFCHSRGRNSTPLTSETLGDEIKDSLASVKRTPIKKLRSLSKEADIDRIRVGSRSVNQSIEYSRTSAKAIGKRKAILLEHSPLNSAVSKLVKNANTFLKRVRSTSQIDVHSRFALGDCRSNETIGSLHPSAPMLETSTAFSAEDSEALSAEKARLSLERICAGFSSGSFGSLESTTDLSSVDHPLPDVPSLSVGDTTAEAKKLPSVRSRTFGPESQSFSCLFVKTPTPLVSKYCPSKLPSPLRPATNSLKTMPYSTMRTPRKSTSHLRLTKMTAAVSSSPSPRKKTIYKRTSPLRIAKKAKGNVSVRSSPFRA